MITRALRHIRGNAVAYAALFFAIGGGGGYALAATVTLGNSTVHACVSKKNGAVYIARKCTKNTRALVFNQRGPAGRTGAAGTTGPAGVSAVQAFGAVNSVGTIASTDGMAISEVSPGVFDVTVTAGGCSSAVNVPIVSPWVQASGGGTPEVATGPSQVAGVTFVVDAGQIQNGTYVAGSQGFDVEDQCQ